MTWPGFSFLWPRPPSRGSPLLLALCLVCLWPSARGQGRFLLITDFHLDQKYDRHGNRTNMCHGSGQEGGGNGTPKGGGGEQPELGPFGERTCDAPPALVEFMLDEAERHIPKPDFIIWTGDTPAHVQYSDTEFLKTMALATDLVKKRFPGILVIPVLGNHDMSPSNSFPDEHRRQQDQLYSGIFELWKDWIGEEAKETFLRGGYYRFKSPLDGSDYLVLNTNLYYVLNRALPSFEHPDDPTGQFAFLERELEDIKGRNGAVHILAHVPPGAYEWDTLGTAWNPEMPKNYNKRLTNLLVDYAQWTRWLLFGHLHTDTFRILKDPSGNPVQRMFLSPAVTPMFELNNPAFRIFEYNTTDLDITDIKTFYVDLDQLNKEGPGRVKAQLEYSMREEYGLASLGAKGMNGLLERMASNESLFGQYIRHNKVMFMSPSVSSPDRRVHLCVIGNVDLDGLEQCTSSINGAEGRASTVLPLSVGLFLLCLLSTFLQ